MVRIQDKGVYLVDGQETLSLEGLPSIEEARKGTMAWGILQAHNQSTENGPLLLKFDSVSIPDNAYMKQLRSAREQGLQQFALPCLLANDHNSLCASGGTCYKDQQDYALSTAIRYGGDWIPPHLAVVHQYIREMVCQSGQLLLGADDHARYGPLGAMGVGKGGEKQVDLLLGRVYQLDAFPPVVAVRLTGQPPLGVGPMDVALALLEQVKVGGYVQGKILEFIGDGISNLDLDFRCGVDIMTAEMGCWSTIWATDSLVEAYYAHYGRRSAYRPIRPERAAYYDGLIDIDLSSIEPMIALPFSPDQVYSISALLKDPMDILEQVERKALDLMGDSTAAFSLRDKVREGKLYAQQGVVAGCVGGTYGNLSDMADLLQGQSIQGFSLSVYPASQPVTAALWETGSALKLSQAGVVLRTSICGPCAGFCDVPANGDFSIRHTPRNVFAREGAKAALGQVSGVALMDARSIAATARNCGAITPATSISWEKTRPDYVFRGELYQSVYKGWGHPQAGYPLKLAPGIK